jgi:hypothetical protein
MKIIIVATMASMQEAEVRILRGPEFLTVTTSLFFLTSDYDCVHIENIY